MLVGWVRVLCFLGRWVGCALVDWVGFDGCELKWVELEKLDPQHIKKILIERVVLSHK